MKIPRKLPEYMQFDIKVFQGDTVLLVEFLRTNGEPLPSYLCKLTPSQWSKASVFLNRKLILFAGYVYQVKNGVNVGTYKIR